MNEYTGSILELKDKQAIIITDSCDFVIIQRQSQMFVGQQITFTKSELNKTNKKYLKYIALAASFFIISLCSIFYFQIFVSNTVFAYVDVDINPSVEFSIDKNAKVLDTKPLNTDAERLLKELELIDLPIKEAISQVVDTSKQLGYISTSKTNEILISASINENSTQNSSDQNTYDNILTDIGNMKFKVGTDILNPQILEVTPDNRKLAIKNNLSMGRYILYSKIKEKNADITVERAKTDRISDMLDIDKIQDNKKHSSDYTESNNSKFNNNNKENTNSSGNDINNNNNNSSKSTKSSSSSMHSNNTKESNDTSSNNKHTKDIASNNNGNNSNSEKSKKTNSTNTSTDNNSKYNKKN